MGPCCNTSAIIPDDVRIRTYTTDNKDSSVFASDDISGLNRLLPDLLGSWVLHEELALVVHEVLDGDIV